MQLVEEGWQGNTPQQGCRSLTILREAAAKRDVDICIYVVYTFGVNVLFQYGGLDFVWDVHKAAANNTKHGVRFEQACEVFLDPLLRIVDASVADEARDGVIGETEAGNLLFVVHVEREDEAIRIISARSATPMERSDYEKYA
jgi:hypothetical protein